MRSLIRLLADRPALGHEAGRRSGVSESGIWGYVLLSSATVLSTTEFGLRYGELTSCTKCASPSRRRCCDAT